MWFTQPNPDRTFTALSNAIDKWKVSSFETFDTHFDVWPADNSCPIVNDDGQWLGMSSYIIGAWGEDTIPIKVRFMEPDTVFVMLDGEPCEVADLLNDLHNAKSEEQRGNSYRPSSTVDCRQQSKWWAANGKAFRLLDLPAEIRELIYGYAFGNYISPFDSRGSKRIYSSSFQSENLASLLRVSRVVYQEARHVLFNQTTYRLTQQTVASKLLSISQPRPRRMLQANIRKLELALSNEDFIGLFGGTFYKLSHGNDPLYVQGAKALRIMDLDVFRLRIAKPSFFSSGWTDGSCHKVIVDWICELAWPVIRGHNVEIVGAVRPRQKRLFETACREARKDYVMWKGQWGKGEEVTSTLKEWDGDVEGFWDDEPGGVWLLDHRQIKKWTPGRVEVKREPPTCFCKQRCGTRIWSR